MASLSRFSIATFNLYNHQLPGEHMNPGQKPWTEDEFAVKVAWVAQQLHAIDADIVGLQELWSREAMVRVLQAAALEDEYDLLAEPATGSRIVCAALVRKGLLRGTPRWVDHFPPELRLESSGNDAQTPDVKVTIPHFSRPVLNFQVALREQPPLTEVFVAHLKSKLPERVSTSPGSRPTRRPSSRTQRPRRGARDGPPHGRGHRPAHPAHEGHEGHGHPRDRARRPQRRSAQQHDQHRHRAAALPRRRLDRGHGHRPLHGADAAGVPRHPRRLLHPRPRGPARVAGPRPRQRAVLRQQQAPACGSSTGWSSTTTTSTTRTTARGARATTASCASSSPGGRPVRRSRRRSEPGALPCWGQTARAT